MVPLAARQAPKSVPVTSWTPTFTQLCTRQSGNFFLSTSSSLLPVSATSKCNCAAALPWVKPFVFTWMCVCVSVVSSWEQLLPTLASSKATQPLQGRLGPSNRADTTCKHLMSFFEVDIHIQQFQSIQDSAASGPLATNNGSSDRDDVTYP